MTLDNATQFFMWGFILNSLIMILSLGVLPMRPLAHKIHGKLFGLKPESIDISLYAYLAAHKIFTVVFFLVPWLTLLIMKSPS